jgi:fibronectin-binding autotransporter adhesin
MKKHRTDALPRAKIIALAIAGCFIAQSPMVSANPQAPMVVAGQAKFEQVGKTLNITNAPGTVINWQSFNINKDEITRFIQQSSASQVLNRVTGSTDPSRILGTLQSNGRVLLINPNGVLFGAGSRVDVAGLVVSTLNLSNADFAAGKLRFTDTPGAGVVKTEGTIKTATGGEVIIVAPKIENSGIIESPEGTILLAAGRSVEIVDLDRRDIRIEVTNSEQQAINLGTLLAKNVNLVGGLVKNSGVIQATTAQVGENGKIVLKGKHSVENTGTLQANGAQGGDILIQATEGTAVVQGLVEAKGVSASAVTTSTTTGTSTTTSKIAVGGRIEILAEDITVDNATIDVSGEAGGGAVFIGGAYQGGNAILEAPWATNSAVQRISLSLNDPFVSSPSLTEATASTNSSDTQSGTSTSNQPVIPNRQPLQTSRTTKIGPNARIRSDATDEGNGGVIVLWSDEHTMIQGDISAQAANGIGGLVETSSKGLLTLSGAPTIGSGGLWLLDPYNITVVSGTTLINNSGDSGYVPSGTSQIGADLISATLSRGTSVTLDTTGAGTDAGDILISSAISKSSGATATLTLKAHNSITIGAAISSTSGALNLTLQPDQDSSGAGAANFSSGGQVNLGGGTFQFSGTLGLGGGTIANATVLGSSMSISGGTLNAVTIGSNLSTTAGGSANITGDLNLTNGTTFNVGNTTLYFNSAAQAINVAPGATAGTATLRHTGTFYANAGYNSGIVTIGSGVTVAGNGGFYDYYGGSGWVNNGTIVNDTTGYLYLSPSNFTNNGKIENTSSGYLYIQPTNFTQGGTITNSGTGTLNITPTNTWTNTGAINNNSTGALTLSASGANQSFINGANGLVHLNAGTLNLGSAQSPASFLTSAGFTRATGTTLNFSGVLDLGGSTLDIGSNGIFQTGGLGTLSGTIKNGTIIAGTDNHALTVSGGTLNAVTIGSNLSTTAGGSANITGDLNLTNGTTFNVGNTTLYFNSAAQAINVAPGATAGTATLRHTGTFYANAGYNSGIVTIGSGVTVAGNGGFYDYYGGSGWVNNGTIVNDTTGYLYLSPSNFTNNGKIENTSSGYLYIQPTNFTQGGTITNSGTGTLNITPTNTWTNTGAINNNSTGALTLSASGANQSFINGANGLVHLNAGTLNLGSAQSPASFLTSAGFTRATGTTLNFSGVLDLGGSTLDIGSNGIFQTGGLGTLSGTIKNGTIIAGTDNHALTVSGGTLNAVTIGSNLSTTAGGSANITGDLNLTNGTTFNVGNTTLYFNSAAQAINVAPGATAGTATLRHTGTFYANAGYNSGIVTIGSGVTVAGNGGFYDYYGGSGWVNNGTIVNDTTGYLYLSPSNFTNNGKIENTSSGYLYIQPTNFTQGGTITNSGTGTLNITPTNTWTNTGAINNNSTGALTLSASGANQSFINGANGLVHLNAGTLNLGSAQSPASFLTSAGFTRATGTTLNFSGVLDLGGSTLDIGSNGIFQTGGLGTLSGTIKNGTIIAGTDNHALTVSGGTLNAVTIGSNLSTTAGGSANITGDLNLTNGTTFNVGNTTLYFNSAAQAINVAPGATAGTATLRHTGTFYANAGYNSGIVTIGSGVTVAGNGGFYDYYGGSGWVNNGTIVNDTTGYLYLSPSNFTNNGKIENTSSGYLYIQPTNFTQGGTISVANGGRINILPFNAWTNNGTLAGIGTIQISSGATPITINGTIAPGVASGDTTGTLYLIGNLTMGSSSTVALQIADGTPGGFDSLKVSGSANFSNSTLQISGAGTTENLVLVTAGGGITGNFGSTVNSTSIPSLQYFDGRSLLASNLNLTGSKVWLNVDNAGTWNTATNWSGSTLPISTDSTLIMGSSGVIYVAGTHSVASISGKPNLDLNGTLTVNTAQEFGSLKMTGGTLTVNSDLSLAGGLDWLSGTITGAGKLITTGVSTLRSGSSKTLKNKIWDNSGTATLTGGTLYLYDDDATLTTAFNNLGTLSGTAILSIGTNTTLNNVGTINPGGTDVVGTLTIIGNVNLSTGTLVVDLGGTANGASDLLHIQGNVVLGGNIIGNLINDFTPSIGDYIPVVTMTGSASGTFATTSPTGFATGYNLSAGEGARLIYGSSSGGSRTFTNAAGGLNWENAGNWTGSTLPTSSDTVIISGGTDSFAVTHASGDDTIASLILNTNNSLTVSGGSLAVSGNSIINGSLFISGGSASFGGTIGGTTGSATVSSGTLTLNGASSFNTVTLSGGQSAISGVITGSGALTTSVLNWASHLNTTGIVTVNNTLNIDPGAARSSGVINNYGTATLGTTAGVYFGVPLSNSAIFNNYGTLNINNNDEFWQGSSTAFSGAVPTTYTFSGSGARFVNQASGVINRNSYVNGSIFYGLAFDNFGTMNFIGDGVLALRAGGTLSGVVNYSGSRTSGNATLGALYLQGGTFNLSGTLGANSIVYAETGSTNIAGNLTVSNNALLQRNSGTLSWSSGNLVLASGSNLKTGNASLTQSIGSNLIGIGTLDVGTGTFTANGSITPGGTGVAGTLNVIGALTLGTNSNLNIDIGGVDGQSDAVNVTGNVTVGGTLAGSLLAGYSPQDADAMPIITMTGTGSGTFANLSIPANFIASYGRSSGEWTRLVYSTGSNVFTGEGGSNAWENLLNWSLGLPTSSSNVLISGVNNVVHSTGNDTIAGLRIDTGNSLNISGGSLTITGNTLANGALSTTSTGTLTLGTNSTIESLTLAGAFNFKSGTATIKTLSAPSMSVSGGQITIGSASNNTSTLSGGALSVTNGTLTLDGDLTVGTASVASPGTLTFNGGELLGLSSLSNTGTLNLSNVTIDYQVANTGTMGLTGGVTFTQLFTNTGGVLNLSGDNTFQSGLTQSSGTLTLASGSTTTMGTGSIFALDGGTMRGSGTIQGDVQVGSATIAPGFSPGTINITGNMTLSSTSIIVAELASATSYDQILVGGTATLAGTLNVSMLNGYTPTFGTTFDIISATSVSGNFGTLPSNPMLSFSTLPTTFQIASNTNIASNPIITFAQGTVVTTLESVTMNEDGTLHIVLADPVQDSTEEKKIEEQLPVCP